MLLSSKCSIKKISDIFAFRNCEDTTDSADFLSTYMCQEPSIKVKCVKLESAAGLIHTQLISSLLCELRFLPFWQKISAYL